MSDNKAVKGVGLLALLSLMFARTCKNCEHESSTFIREGREAASHEKVKPSEGFFSCNKTHVRDVPETPPIYSTADDETKSIYNEDEVFLNKTGEHEFSYTDRTTSSFSSISDIKIDNSKTLIVDGDLSEDEIKALNKKGVKFICDRTVYEQQKNVKNYEVILVFSEDREVLKNLYGVSEDQVDDVIKIAQPALADINITQVSSKERLDKVLASFYERKITPVIVFNNKNKTLFDYPLWHYGISNAITCNSYNLGTKLFFHSTSYIGIDNVLKSLKNNHQSTLFDFYKNFSGNYATQLYNDKKYLVTVVATSTLAIGSSAGYIVYYNSNKKHD